MATADKDCPEYLWDEALLQIEATINQLKPFQDNADISAYQSIWGHQYDYAAHPIFPSEQGS
jgi:hypothetical protein